MVTVRRRHAAVAVAGLFAAAGAMLVLAGPGLSSSTAVAGRMTLEAVTDASCASPEGICWRGEIKEDAKSAKKALAGTYTVTVTSLTPTVDTPSTGVVLYTGDMVITTARGTLTCKDAGALATDAERSLATVCSMTGGTGSFAGASGRLRIAGVPPEFSPPPAATGDATYEGTVSVP